MPCTSVFSRADGLSDWRPCLQPAGPAQENVEIVSGHVGMACHPATLYLLVGPTFAGEGGMTVELVIRRGKPFLASSGAP